MALLKTHRTHRTRVRRSSAASAGLLLLLALGTAPVSGGAAVAAPAPSQAPDLPEYVIKAGFLFNFAKYVDWPAEAFESAAAPIEIGVVGKDPFGAELERILKGKTVRDRPFKIARFNDAASIRRCHILFVPRSETPRLSVILEKVDSWPVLLVGEDDGFSKSGGAVNILVENERPRLEINTDAAGRARLIIDVKLLKAATIVRTGK